MSTTLERGETAVTIHEDPLLRMAAKVTKRGVELPDEQDQVGPEVSPDVTEEHPTSASSVLGSIGHASYAAAHRALSEDRQEARFNKLYSKAPMLFQGWALLVLDSTPILDATMKSPEGRTAINVHEAQLYSGSSTPTVRS